MSTVASERRGSDGGCRRARSARRRAGSRALAWLALALACLAGALLPSTAAAQPVSPYLIELGDAVILPGQDVALVPVYLTSEVPLSTWQMGLDYDDLLLTLDDIDFAGTLSEPLSPSVQWDPFTTPASSFVVAYSSPTPFPAGEHLLAAWLRFTIASGAAIPAGGSIVSGITIVNVEPYPVLFVGVLGGTVVPGVQHGSVTILDYPLLEVDMTEGDFFAPGGVIGVPVMAWTDGPSTVLEMGLDYDDLLMCSIDLSGGAIAAAVGGNVVVSLTNVGSFIHVRIQATNGAIFPSFDGDIIAHLEMILGPTPFAGEFPISLVPGVCTIDGAPVANLIHGQLTLADHFVRGDTNFDGLPQISDAQQILGRVLLGSTIVCDDSADTNDDGNLDISDPIYLLNHLFSSGTPPAAPFPNPGADPTADAFGCL